jgi:hypothetical protein
MNILWVEEFDFGCRNGLDKERSFEQEQGLRAVNRAGKEEGRGVS